MKKNLLWRMIAPLLAGFFIASPAHSAEPLKIGVSAGPYGEILTFAAGIAAKEGLAIKIVEFSDYNTPDAALAQGDIDANNFQHLPFLQNQIAKRGYDLVAGPTSIVVPMGVYSKKVTKLDDLPTGATVAVPNDPSNGARGLFLLAKAGLITLKEGTDVSATVLDVVANPKHLKIVELDAAQLPRSLDDVAAATVTLNYAMLAGLDPKTALLLEDEKSKWALVWATRRNNAGDPRIKRYIEIYRSQPVKTFIAERFKGSILPTW
ncbi:L-methionine/D-methionine ABC transporter membrane anchored binding protein [Azospirillaceae bacterium]